MGLFVGIVHVAREPGALTEGVHPLGPVFHLDLLQELLDAQVVPQLFLKEPGAEPHRPHEPEVERPIKAAGLLEGGLMLDGAGQLLVRDGHAAARGPSQFERMVGSNRTTASARARATLATTKADGVSHG